MGLCNNMPSGIWPGFPICLYNVGHKLAGNASCGSLPMKEHVKFFMVEWHTQQAPADTCLNRCHLHYANSLGKDPNNLSLIQTVHHSQSSGFMGCTIIENIGFQTLMATYSKKYLTISTE